MTSGFHFVGIFPCGSVRSKVYTRPPLEVACHFSVLRRDRPATGHTRLGSPAPTGIPLMLDIIPDLVAADRETLSGGH